MIHPFVSIRLRRQLSERIGPEIGGNHDFILSKQSVMKTISPASGLKKPRFSPSLHIHNRRGINHEAQRNSRLVR
jgi:hypothetical protein